VITPALHNAFVKFSPLFRGDLIERTVYRETGNLPFSLSLSLSLSLVLSLSSYPFFIISSPSLFASLISSRDRFLEVVHNESVPLHRFVPTGARSPMHVLSSVRSACVSLCRYENIACQVTRLFCNHWIAVTRNG